MADDTENLPKKPGGVKHDSRGNAVWQWAAESGRHAIESTSRLLKRLEVPGLSIEEDRPRGAKPPEDVAKPVSDMRGRATQGGSRPQAPAPAATATPRAPAHPAAQRPPERALPPDPVKGYDPYGGRHDAARARNAAAARPAPKEGGATRPAATTGDRPSLWSRLFRKD